MKHRQNIFLLFDIFICKIHVDYYRNDLFRAFIRVSTSKTRPEKIQVLIFLMAFLQNWTFLHIIIKYYLLLAKDRMEIRTHDLYKSPINFTLPLKQKKPFDQLKINIEGVQKTNFKPLKVGIRKLPGDFFGKKLNKKMDKPQCLTERIHKKNTVEPQNKNFFNMQENAENHEDILPQAQVTSFFKMAQTPYNPIPEKDKFRSQRKLSQNKRLKNIQDGGSFTTSIHLQSNPSLNDLCATFSKKLLSSEEVEAPQEKQSGLFGKESQINEKVRSVQMKRPSKEISLAAQQQPKTSFMKERVKKYSYLQPPRQYSLGDTISKGKKISEPLNLPSIRKIQ